MGMKVKQESRVRTFLKRVFRFPKRDKNWKHARLEQNVEYMESACSISSLSKSLSRESLVSNHKKQKQGDIRDWNCGDGKDYVDGDNRGNPQINTKNKNTKKKKKNKKWQVKIDLNETRLVEVKEYEAMDEPETVSQSSVNGRRKAKKNNKSKHNRSSSLENKVQSHVCNTQSDDQELVDIDLDLVLSSFANLRKAGLEADDNHANEQRIRQGAFSSGSTHEVGAVVERCESPDSMSMYKQSCFLHSSEPSTSETLHSADSTKEKKSKKNRRNQQRKESEKCSAVQQEDNKSKIILKSEHKKSRNRRKRKGAYQSIEEEAYQSIELIVSHTRDELPLLCSEQSEPQVTKQNTKKSRKNKKKKNVRSPEDDLEFEMSRDILRRRKHQDLYASDIIADLGTPAESVEQVPSGKKKLRRRKLKLKFNKDKKKLHVKHYDELRSQPTDDVDHQGDTRRHASAREVGRRMWKACKTGLRYMKAGLVYYSSTPVNVTNFTPLLKRYDDGFEEYGKPGTSTYRTRY